MLSAGSRRKKSGHAWNGTWAVSKALVLVISAKVRVRTMSGPHAPPWKFSRCGRRNFKIQWGDMPGHKSDMGNEIIGLAIGRHHQSDQPSRTKLMRERRDGFRQRALRHALAFSSRRLIVAWLDHTGFSLAIASSATHSTPD